MTTLKIKLLAATVPSSVGALQRMSDSTIQVITAVAVDEALAVVDDKPDVILCNMHFAEGSMFEFLRAVRAHRYGAAIPFLIIDATQGGPTPAIAQSVELASKTLGADQVIHILPWRDELGDEIAFRKVIALAREYVVTTGTTLAVRTASLELSSAYP